MASTAKIDITKPVKIRQRDVICRKPVYGRFGEYQVVQGNRVLSRWDLRSQAERWCADKGLRIAAAGDKSASSA